MSKQYKAIIVGATSGIGREVAIHLARHGVVLGLAGRRVEKLEALRCEFGDERVHIAQLDVTNKSATETLDELIAKVGAPDLLLYASGIGKQNPELDLEIEADTVMTNSWGMVRLVDHFINFVKKNPAYNAQHRAHVAVITSVAGTMGMGSAPAYSATKSMQSCYLTALSQFARMQRIPMIFSDIRPGFVATDILNPAKHYPMLMTADKAARCILRGLKRRRRIIIFDWRFKLIVGLWRLIPRWLWERLTIVRN
ncbi:MAG: SDR family NAD(P)-dependent oxidoreductase [Alistipes sp.]|nr:SDR family NAD(P)-dependent oxidoreductase [Alistipes sp.]